MKKLRPSPSRKASQTSSGTIEKGNDSNYWIVSKAGKWVPFSNGKLKKYVTQDNGDQQYRVIVAPNAIAIVMKEEPELAYLIKNYKKVLPGKDNALKLYGPSYRYKKNGNTLLIECAKNTTVDGKKVNAKYIAVQNFGLYKFNTDDEIVKYFSPTGNSRVPYPFGIGQKWVYLILEQLKLPIELYSGGDPYSGYYSTILNKKLSKEQKKKELSIYEKMDVKGDL